MFDSLTWAELTPFITDFIQTEIVRFGLYAFIGVAVAAFAVRVMIWALSK